MKWRILFYESRTGQKPVEKFINSLQSDTRSKLLRLLYLLEEFGPELGMPSAKPIGGGMYELRIRGKEEVRSLYVFRHADTVVVLHGFKKKTMAISRSDIRIARQRQQDIGNR